MSGWADSSTSAAIQSVSFHPINQRLWYCIFTQSVQEICRFESVHPNIYAVYELLQCIEDPTLQNQIREHVINIEDSFVNSQEWTISRQGRDYKLLKKSNLKSVWIPPPPRKEKLNGCIKNRR